MKNLAAVASGILILSVVAGAADPVATINYTYDAQNRLVQASYGDSEKLFYAYDAANNMELYISITDSDHLQSFLIYLSMLEQVNPSLAAAFQPWRDCMRALAAASAS